MSATEFNGGTGNGGRDFDGAAMPQRWDDPAAARGPLRGMALPALQDDLRGPYRGASGTSPEVGRRC